MDPVPVAMEPERVRPVERVGVAERLERRYSRLRPCKITDADGGDLDLHPLAVVGLDLHVRADADDTARRGRALIDHLRAVEPVAKDRDLPLEESLLVLRGVVLEVLREVAEGTRGGDRLDDL